MRLLQVSLRSLLLYSMMLLLISIPVSLFSIREILNEEIDDSLLAHTDQFLEHIRGFEYLEDLEPDLEVFDQLSYNIDIKPFDGKKFQPYYETVLIYDSLENEDRPFRLLRSLVVIKGKQYVLSMNLSLVDSNELIFAIGTVQIALAVFLAVGLLLLNRSLSRKLWKPFYNTLNQLKAYQLDKNEAIKIEDTNIIEFDDLNKTVNHLTERNRKVFLQQKEFIENASHELQTPLAIFQSKLDNLMQSPLSEKEATAIQELEEITQRMARLNKNLLLLSKIDNEQFTDVIEIDIAELAERVLSDLKQVSNLSEITIHPNIHPLRIRANKTLIEVMLTNLFHNAIRHTTSQGNIFVKIQEGTFMISNTGNPLKMDDSKMFERFTKESASEKSTGLGLAIVKRICDTCSYSINYNFSDGKHTFTVTF
jgi:signal transduction histidine kinase